MSNPILIWATPKKIDLCRSDDQGYAEVSGAIKMGLGGAGDRNCGYGVWMPFGMATSPPPVYMIAYTIKPSP